MSQPRRPEGDTASDDEALTLGEDAADIQAAEEARAEMRDSGATPIPWEQVKVDLGLQ